MQKSLRHCPISGPFWRQRNGFLWLIFSLGILKFSKEMFYLLIYFSFFFAQFLPLDVWYWTLLIGMPLLFVNILFDSVSSQWTPYIKDGVAPTGSSPVMTSTFPVPFVFYKVCSQLKFLCLLCIRFLYHGHLDLVASFACQRFCIKAKFLNTSFY